MRLYVRNIPWEVTKLDLAEHFRRHGFPPITAIVAHDGETGRSKGFGYVEVQNEHSREAIDTMNRTILGGRELFVDIARPRPS